MEMNEEKQNSVTLKKDSKGNYNWDIKIYFNDNEQDTLKRIHEINKCLKADYG